MQIRKIILSLLSIGISMISARDNSYEILKCVKHMKEKQLPIIDANTETIRAYTKIN